MVAQLATAPNTSGCSVDHISGGSAAECDDVIVARSLVEVGAAWGLVYGAYLRARYIRPNPYRLYTSPAAASRRAVVLLELCHQRLESTLTAGLDAWRGLPLDALYPRELDDLRRGGRRLLECGQFAHRLRLAPRPGAREDGAADHAPRPAGAAEGPPIRVSLRRLLGPALAYAVQNSATDILIGATEADAPLYAAALQVVPIAGPRPCRELAGAPLVLLQCDLLANLHQRPLPPVIADLARHPIARTCFDGRHRFVPGLRTGGTADLAAYLQWAYPGREVAA